MFPSVTCLCLTRNRRAWLPQAIACFRAQAYTNAELLIVADGEDVRDLVEHDAGNIRLITSPDGMTVGAKRNLGCDAAFGEMIAHWDDDDYSGPGRLSHQVGILQRENVAVTGFHSMCFTDRRGWWRYKGADTFALGTSLMYRRDWWREHRFAALQCGQDEDFSREARRAGQLVSIDAGAWMYATNHAGNTSPRKTGNSASWEPLPGFVWKDAA